MRIGVKSKCGSIACTGNLVSLILTVCLQNGLIIKYWKKLNLMTLQVKVVTLSLPLLVYMFQC